jgi:hypothetical protein
MEGLIKKRGEWNSDEKTFVIVFLATIIISRLLLLFISAESWIWGDSLHHIHYGIIIVAVSLLCLKVFEYDMVVPFAVGIGLIADELIYILPFFYGTGAKHHYFGLPSILGAISLSVLVFAYRKRLSVVMKK